MGKKINWQLALYIALIAVGLTAIILCIAIKIWVIMEYGDLPISEVPTWAIPWIMNGSGR